MKIIIDYESSWRNSFLDGSNNEPLPKRGRKFIASMTGLRDKENFQLHEIKKDTVMGILNRLIGDQRKLYQSRSNFDGASYYFADIENDIYFEDKPKIINQEMAYIRNMSGSTDQNSFTGMITVNDPIFQSEYSKPFWGVLTLDLPSLCEFILQDTTISSEIDLNPVSILNQLEFIKKQKPVEYSGIYKRAADTLSEIFPKYKPLNSKGELLLLPLYCSSLYLQLKRREKLYDMQSAKSKMGGISGISNNGFTPKDFMHKYTTGGKKLIYGNPYVREEFVKGEGKLKLTLTKVSGQLEINLNIDFEKAKELKNMIDNAGVSSFYLGKKGLAYVSQIEIR